MVKLINYNHFFKKYFENTQHISLIFVAYKYHISNILTEYKSGL